MLKFIQVKRVHIVKAALHECFLRMVNTNLNCKIWDVKLSVGNMAHFLKLFAYPAAVTTDASTDLMKVLFMRIKIISFAFLCRSANM